MVSALDSGASGPGSSPDRGGHCVVFLGKTVNSHSGSLHPRCVNGYRRIVGWLGKPNKMRGSDLRWTSILSRGNLRSGIFFFLNTGKKGMIAG